MVAADDDNNGGRQCWQMRAVADENGSQDWAVDYDGEG
jgi:hypothetical protein